MATKNRLSLDFPMFDHLKEQLEKAGGNALKTAVDKALRESVEYTDKELMNAMAPHRKTGTVEKSLDSKPDWVMWSGTMASMEVGFNLYDGGLPSLFLMYGTKVHGQPHVEPDRKLYNALYGSKVKRQIQKIQENAFRSIAEQVIS